MIILTFFLFYATFDANFWNKMSAKYKWNRVNTWPYLFKLWVRYALPKAYRGSRKLSPAKALPSISQAWRPPWAGWKAGRPERQPSNKAKAPCPFARSRVRRWGYRLSFHPAQCSLSFSSKARLVVRSAAIGGPRYLNIHSPGFWGREGSHEANCSQTAS